MKNKIKELESEFETSLKQAVSSKDLEALKVRFLGKKGPITDLMSSLRDCTPEERPQMGKYINEAKVRIAKRLEETFNKVQKSELAKRVEDEKLDVSLPGRKRHLGTKHLLSAAIEKMVDILANMGFSVVYTPEVDKDYYNYSGLNYPSDHPARDMQDTYYITKDILLRSHTTNFQQRVMEKYEPPIRMMCPGKCYRNETISSRSHVIFHQIDVMYIDRGVSFSDLLGTLEEFYSQVFNRPVEIRTRPSYFPFVEPGVEVDVKCTLCNGKGCSICKHSGWLEVCGAGMVHPEVLKQGGIDPEEFSGYAWGGGVERIVQLIHGISDIRLFMENDMRFLSQFPE